MNGHDSTAAADGLQAILRAIEPTNTAKDNRIRQALLVGVEALQNGAKPLPAIDRYYRSRPGNKPQPGNEHGKARSRSPGS
jgi:hypothetical protein